MQIFNAAVIGLGHIGLTYEFDPKRVSPSTHSGAYAQNNQINLLGAHDLDLNKSTKLKRISSETILFSDVKKLYTNYSLDIISIATPPIHHLDAIDDILHNCMELPKVIFCEKPIVSNLQEINELKAKIKEKPIIIIPNVIRRWNTGFQKLTTILHNNMYGPIQKIHIRYTRGILNSGAHFIDLVHWWAGEIVEVNSLYQVSTSSDVENDFSYTFYFKTIKGVNGIAEAYSDSAYYMFELDIYCERGKVEIRDSGDNILFYRPKEHYLFSGINKLYKSDTWNHLFNESNMEKAVNHMVGILENKEQPLVTLEDNIKCTKVSLAVVRSFKEKKLIKIQEV